MNKNGLDLRKRLLIKKAKEALSGSMPLGLLNFEAVCSDPKLWESFPKGGLASGTSSGGPEDAMGPGFRWSQWALVPLRPLLGEACVVASAEDKQLALRSLVESFGCSVEAAFELGSAEESAMPVVSARLESFPSGSDTIRRLRDWLVAGPLAAMGSRAELCFGGESSQASFHSLRELSQDTAWVLPVGSDRIPSARALHASEWVGVKGVVESAIEAGLVLALEKISEISQLEYACAPGAPMKSRAL